MVLNLQRRRGRRDLPRICGRATSVSITLGAFVLLIAYALVTHAADDSRLNADAASIVAGLDPRVAGSLSRISGLERRLLALRSYLRAGDTLPARWSWSEAEIRAYEQSQEFRDAQAELDRVIEAFAAAFPGYTLYVNRQVRSLDVQIERWNTNRSVEEAAQALLSELRQARPDRSVGRDGEWLRRKLTDWTPTVPVTLAAPGLSAHGQSRAFDFQVERGGTLVAGTEAERAAQDWDAAGWTERLKEVIARASTHLRGPLVTPREPWHYVYEPKAPSPGASEPPEAGR
jgi:hypothetical protein